MQFAPAFRVSFAGSTCHDFVSHLAFKPVEVEILSKTLVVEDGKEPVGTFTALDTLALEDTRVGRQVLRNGDERPCPVQTTQKAWQRRSISQRPASLPDTAVASTAELSQAVAQVAETVREVKASTSQRVRVYDHLDPMDRLPDADEQELWRPTTPSSRAVHHATALHVRWNSLPPSHEHRADFAVLTPYGRRVQKALCYKLFTDLATGSVTRRTLAGSSGLRHMVRLLARVPHPAAFSQTSARRSVHGKSRGSGRVKRWRISRKHSVTPPLPTTTRGGCLSVPKIQARGERLALARATRLADHEASGGAAHTFDASRSKEFNAVAGDDKFWAAQVRYLAWDFLALGEASFATRPRVSRVAVRARRRQRPLEASSCSGVRSCVSEAQGRHLSYRLQWVQCKICREWSCSHDECSDPSCVSCRTCFRCLQPHRLASCPVQHKRKADRATKDKNSWK